MPPSKNKIFHILRRTDNCVTRAQENLKEETDRETFDCPSISSNTAPKKLCLKCVWGCVFFHDKILSKKKKSFQMLGSTNNWLPATESTAVTIPFFLKTSSFGDSTTGRGHSKYYGYKRLHSAALLQYSWWVLATHIQNMFRNALFLESEHSNNNEPRKTQEINGKKHNQKEGW